MKHLSLFTHIGITSFSKIPIFIPRPQFGQTWAIMWEVSDGELISSGDTVVTAVSESDGQQWSFSSPVPGRIRCVAQSTRSINCDSLIGSIDFGLVLEEDFSHERRMLSLETKKVSVRHHVAEEEHQSLLEMWQSLQMESKRLQQNLDELKRQNEFRSDSLRQTENDDMDTAIPLSLFIAPLQRKVSDAVEDDFPVVEDLFLRLLLLEESVMQLLSKSDESAGELFEPPSSSENSLGDHDAGALRRLYDWRKEKFSENNGGLPEKYLEEQNFYWDYVRDAHANILARLQADDPTSLIENQEKSS